MPGNSFQNAQTPDGKYAPSMGQLHLFNDTDRSTSWDVSPNPSTSWVTQDLSGRVPKGTKALYGFLDLSRTDAETIILIRDTADADTDTGGVRLRSFRHSDAQGWMGAPIIIKATDGKFDIKEYSASYEASNFNYVLWGYYI